MLQARCHHRATAAAAAAAAAAAEWLVVAWQSATVRC